MYKLLFIDEQQGDIDDFKDYVEKSTSKENIHIESEFPLEDLDEMIDVIFGHNPDALITDFMLNEYKETIKYNVPYNGVELVNKILEIREGFPCFVITSFDDDAVKISEDVNIVYIKGILHGAEDKIQAKATFIDKIGSQIEHYKSRLQLSEARLSELLQKRIDGTASLPEEKEIIELDSFLEKAIDKRHSIPKEFKELSNLSKLDSILSKVDQLLNKSTNGK